MGNLWLRASESKLQRAELGLFESVGLDPQQDLIIRNVPIYRNHSTNPDPENFIHEIKVIPNGGAEGLPKLLMIHGYGGGGAVFYKMIKHLRQYFQVYTIDLLGQGMSGRPDYEPKHDFDATIAYFTESINAYVEQSDLRDTKFILLGHSMGGMFAGWYALKYP